MEISEVRKRLRHTIDAARKRAAQRRARADAAAAHYEQFLTAVAEPVCRMLVGALRAEGHPFELFTPASTIRLASGRSGEEFIEIALDTAGGVAEVVGRARHGRGRDVITIERPLREDTPVEALTEEDVLQFLLEAVEPFIAR